MIVRGKPPPSNDYGSLEQSGLISGYSWHRPASGPGQHRRNQGRKIFLVSRFPQTTEKTFGLFRGRYAALVWEDGDPADAARIAVAGKVWWFSEKSFSQPSLPAKISGDHFGLARDLGGRNLGMGANPI